MTFVDADEAYDQMMNIIVDYVRRFRPDVSRVDIEDSIGRDIYDILQTLEQSAYDNGYDDGYIDCKEAYEEW